MGVGVQEWRKVHGLEEGGTSLGVLGNSISHKSRYYTVRIIALYRTALNASVVKVLFGRRVFFKA